ncbi:AAA family ATPase, partial [Thermus scotoductus]
MGHRHTFRIRNVGNPGAGTPTLTGPIGRAVEGRLRRRVIVKSKKELDDLE